MDINKYAFFAKTAELKNLSAAAEYLGYTQSAASHIISSLEKELGFALFSRSRYGMELTANGVALLPYVYQILQNDGQISQMSKDIRELKSGDITVVSISPITIRWLSKIVREFRLLYPGININLLDGSYEQITRWITDGRADCGFTVSTQIRDIPYTPLVKDTLYAVLPEKYLLAERATVTCDELAELDFIAPSRGTQGDIRNLIAGFHAKPKPIISAVGDATTLALVQQGLGFTILTGIHLISSYSLERVRISSIQNCKTHEIVLATTQGKGASPATNAFSQFAQEWILARHKRLTDMLPLERDAADSAEIRRGG